MDTLIINNFLPYPNQVRAWALQQEFFEKWSGGTLVRVDGPEAALAALRVIC